MSLPIEVQLKLILLLRCTHQTRLPTDLSHLPPPFGVGTVRTFTGVSPSGVLSSGSFFGGPTTPSHPRLIRPLLTAAERWDTSRCPRSHWTTQRLSRGAPVQLSSRNRRIYVARLTMTSKGLPIELHPRPECAPPHIRFSVRSAHDFASSFLPTPITETQLPLANLQAGLLG